MAQGMEQQAPQGGGQDPAAQLGEIVGQVAQGMDVIVKALPDNKEMQAAQQTFMKAVQSIAGGGAPQEQDPSMPQSGPGAMEAGAANARPMNPGMR